MSDRLNAGLHHWERITQALVLTQSLPMGEVCLCCTQPCNLLLRSAELSFSQCIGRCRMVCGACRIRVKAFKCAPHGAGWSVRLLLPMAAAGLSDLLKR